MEVPVKLGIEGLSQMARDRFMAIFQATLGKCSPTGLQTPTHRENPGTMEGAFQGGYPPVLLRRPTASPGVSAPLRTQDGIA